MRCVEDESPVYALETSLRNLGLGVNVRPHRRRLALLAFAIGIAIALAWLGLAVSLARSRTPWSNEAWAAIPAYNLVTHGSSGTTVLEFKNTWLRGLDRHTYWTMPLHFVVQALWYKIVGFSLLRQRLLSIAFALVLLAAWFRIVLRVTGSLFAASTAALLIGFESNFLNGAANGRMDMMCAALGSASIAVWFELHMRSRRKALLAAHSLAACAILTHPCGILFSAALVFLTLSNDRWRIRVRDLPAILAPYLVAGAAWGLYIAQAPADFRSQFLGNLSGFAGEYATRTRFNGMFSPWRALAAEIKLRYLLPFGFRDLTWMPGRITAMWLAVCGTSAAMTMLIPALRRQRTVRMLAGAASCVFLLMTLLEGMKFQHYLIHFLPWLVALAAITADYLWSRHPRTRPLLIATLILLPLSQSALVLRTIRANPLRNEFGRVADQVRGELRPGDRVIAGADFGYALGFSDVLHDDVRLGYYTGLRPRFIITSGWYRDWFQAAAKRNPALYAYIQHTLNEEFHPVLHSGEYVLYRRNVE